MFFHSQLNSSYARRLILHNPPTYLRQIRGYVGAVGFGVQCSIPLRRFKAIIAYSSIGHMNVANLGIFSNTIQGIEGALVLIIAHGIVSPALFICVVVLYDRYHTRILKYYRGLNINMPVFSLFFFVFILANIATPLSVNFIGEFMTFTGAVQQNPVFTFIGASGIVLSASYSIWLFNRIIFGSISAFLGLLEDMTRREFMLLLPFLLITLVFGIFPNLLLEPIHLAVSNLLNA